MAVEPVDHAYVTAPVPVSVVPDPLQIVVNPVMATGGNGFTVTVVVATMVQLFASVAVTVYPWLAVGETTYISVDGPDVHTYETAPEAVSVVVIPLHIVVNPVMDTTDGIFPLTVRSVVTVLSHPVNTEANISV